MKYTKEQLVKLRETSDRLLRKMEEEENDKYAKLALSFKNSQSAIDRILKAVEGKSPSTTLVESIQKLMADLKEAVLGMRPDMSPVIQAIRNLQGQMRVDIDVDSVVAGLNRIERMLAKQPAKQNATKDRTDEIVEAINGIKVDIPVVEFPDSISVNNFPPQKIPQPVTNINLNPLRGLVHTTATTVTATLTTLPGYGILDNRRSMLIYNNDSSKTLFIGGSDVTTSNGLPIPPKSYSPPIDAGPKMVIYGVVSSGSIDTRVIELSNNTGA